MKRLGIILECGPYGADRQVIEFLIGRIRTDIQCIYKPLDNKKKLESDCGMTAKSLIDIEKCDYVLIIWDLYPPWKDKKEKPCRHEDKEKIFKALKDAIVSEKKVILICIEAELESWLIADHEALTNYIRQRKNPHVLQNEIKKYKSPDKILNIRNHFH